MKMKKLLAVISFTLLAGTANAKWSTSDGIVTKIYSNNGSNVIRTTISDSVCTAGNFWWPTDDSDAQDMFALVLTAISAGKKIQVHYDPNTLDCQHGDSTKITHISMTM